MVKKRLKSIFQPVDSFRRIDDRLENFLQELQRVPACLPSFCFVGQQVLHENVDVCPQWPTRGPRAFDGAEYAIRVLCESEMTAERAFELKKNLDQIERFVQDQREALQSLLHGVSISKSGKGQYGQHKSKVRSRFVHRKA